MARPGFQIRNVEPSSDPSWRRASNDLRLQFWGEVVRIGLEVKGRELAAGLDRSGNPMAGLSPLTLQARDDNTNSVTGRQPYSPMGLASSGAPALQSTGSASRTRSLLTGVARPDCAEFFWRDDPHTGRNWGEILMRHRQGFHQLFRYPRHGWGHVPSRDVFGISPDGIAEIRRRAAQWWKKTKGQVPLHGAEPAPAEEPIPDQFERPTSWQQPAGFWFRGHLITLQGSSKAQVERMAATGLLRSRRNDTRPPGAPRPFNPPAPLAPLPQLQQLRAEITKKPVPATAPLDYRETKLKFAPSRPAKNLRKRTIVVDVAKVEAAFRQDGHYYVPPGGSGGGSKPGAYANVVDFLETAAEQRLPVEQSELNVDLDGVASFSDGRHRFAVLRDLGLKNVPVSVFRSDYARILALFGWIGDALGGLGL